ncbi:MAG: Phosphorylase family [uncultured bacterium]|nr:MAG: Phosphorylase family [uncultured bacterium]
MIKLLIVDDDKEKMQNILNAIALNPHVSRDEIITASDVFSARKLLSEYQFDILILDLMLPERYGFEPKPDSGISLLKELSSTKKLRKPIHIIGLTQFEDLKSKAFELFQSHLFHIVTYEEESVGWQGSINNYINYLANVKIQAASTVSAEYDFDLAVVAALSEPELSSLLNIPANWSTCTFKDDHSIYHVGKFSGENKMLRVVCSSLNQMGMPAAATLTSKLIYHFRPKYIAITGIAAGVVGVGNYGDILIPDISWDYGSGKIAKDDGGTVCLWPDPKSIQLDTQIREWVIDARMSGKYVDIIRSSWQGNKPDSVIKTILGPFASGSAVIQHDSISRDILRHNRKLIGIDMETYGVFYAASNSILPAPKVFAFKSICDFADEKKNDNYQTYAAFTSAQYLYRFALDYL